MGLILSRRVGESIKIGDVLVVTVLELDGGRVQLDFEGPRSIPIHRTEAKDKRSPAEKMREAEAVELSGKGGER